MLAQIGRFQGDISNSYVLEEKKKDVSNCAQAAKRRGSGNPPSFFILPLSASGREKIKITQEFMVSLLLIYQISDRLGEKIFLLGR